MPFLYTSDPSLFADAADIVRLFSADKHVIQLEGPKVPSGLVLHLQTGSNASEARLYRQGIVQTICRDETQFLTLGRTEGRERVRQRKHQGKRALYRALRQVWNRQLPWGSLTGIRPVKLFRELADRHGIDAARQEFEKTYLVGHDRIELSERILHTQTPFVPSQEDACVYVGIPFCPTRCRYCSFIAQDVRSALGVRDQYLDALLAEISGHPPVPAPVTSIYVGGGTPTTLSETELDALLGALTKAFANVAEYTVEAGRPDTVTAAKLQILRAHGVTRVSINPQTLNEPTLRTIGRRHSCADFYRAMELARGCEAFDINTDMIVGLPGEDEEDVMRTLDGILSCRPENVTVHALARKNAADLSVCSDWHMMAPEKAQALMDAVRARLSQEGYEPYYLYRQKYMSGNLENIGFALPGHACRYNMQHMEEWASVLAFGAGAISKFVHPDGQRIERAANVKDTAQYVGRLGEMIERKRKLFTLANS